MQLRQDALPPLPAALESTPSAPPFPSSRYFQIHFEYLHEIIGGLQQHVAETNRQMALLQQRLDAITASTKRKKAA